MAKIRIDLECAPFDGQPVTFKAPCDASEVDGLVIYYLLDGAEVSVGYSFADANGNDVGDIDMLFSPEAIVKVLLDTNTSRAFVQNADTNAYLEGRFDDKQDKIKGTKGQLVAINDEGFAEAVTLTAECFPEEMLEALKPVKGTDYWTDEDKEEMVEDVLAALPIAEEASF